MLALPGAKIPLRRRYVFERVAVPLDGSQFGEMALPWAAEIAAAFDSEVHLLSVSESGHKDDLNLRQAYLEHERESLTLQISDRKSDSHFKVKVAAMEGDAASATVNYTEKQDVGLVILVSHGRSGLMPWPVGSTASRILSSETKPILFVRAKTLVAEGSSLLLNTLVALDGSSGSEAVLPYTEEISARLLSRITLFRSVRSTNEVVTIGGAKSVELPNFEVERLKREASEYLVNIEARFAGRATSVVRTGPAASEIMRYSDDNRISLIAITSHGQSKVSGWRFGEVAHKVLHSSNVPVFVVKLPPDSR
jgi:nucleotide-binding universal stress UspA family protein